VSICLSDLYILQSSVNRIGEELLKYILQSSVNRIGKEFTRHPPLAGVLCFRESKAAFRTESLAVEHACNLIQHLDIIKYF